MKPTLLLRANYFPFPKTPVAKYVIPSLDSISHTSLISNGFGEGNYFIKKTKFNHWPVYKKITNQTKVVTEIKRVEGDLDLLKRDLLKLDPSLKIGVNKSAGYINIKGDYVDAIKYHFDQELK